MKISYDVKINGRRRRASTFVTWATVAIYIGLPCALVCCGLGVLVWLYGFH